MDDGPSKGTGAAAAGGGSLMLPASKKEKGKGVPKKDDGLKSWSIEANKPGAAPGKEPDAEGSGWYGVRREGEWTGWQGEQAEDGARPWYKREESSGEGQGQGGPGPGEGA